MHCKTGRGTMSTYEMTKNKKTKRLKVIAVDMSRRSSLMNKNDAKTTMDKLLLNFLETVAAFSRYHPSGG